MDESKPVDSHSAATDASLEHSTEGEHELEVPPEEGDGGEKPVEKPKPTRTRYARREQASADALRGLIRDYILEKYPRLMEQEEKLPLTLQVELTPGEPGELSFTPDLRRQLAGQLAEAAAPPAEFMEGAVYDFQAESNEAPGCRPPDSTQVFTGYDSMGRPRWQPWMQVLVDRQDPGVDRVHGGGGGPVVRFFSGKELKAEQLGAHGRASREYALLGQVAGGYFQLPPAYAKMAGDERLALTFQAVETRVEGKFALRLNTLAGGVVSLELEALLGEPSMTGLAKARERAVRALEEVEGKAKAARNPEGFQQQLRRIPRILNALRGDLEGRREGRSSSRGREKRDSGWKADAAAAELRVLFYDQPRDSWVLLGEQGQAHVFTAEGRHLTSFPCGPELIEKRIVSERWRAAGEADAGVLEAIRGGGAGS